LVSGHFCSSSSTVLSVLWRLVIIVDVSIGLTTPSSSSSRRFSFSILNSSIRRPCNSRNCLHLLLLSLMLFNSFPKFFWPEIHLVECVQVMIIGAYVDDPIGHRWGGTDSVPGGVAPDPGTCSGIQSIHVMVPRADVDDPTGNGWGGLNTRRRLENPQSIASISVQGVQRVVSRADIDDSISASRGGLNRIARGVSPQQPASPGFKSRECCIK